jgi:hypothetical protein
VYQAAYLRKDVVWLPRSAPVDGSFEQSEAPSVWTRGGEWIGGIDNRFHDVA